MAIIEHGTVEDGIFRAFSQWIVGLRGALDAALCGKRPRKPIILGLCVLLGRHLVISCCGGTYAQSGTTEAYLNVTYNYAKHYVRVLGGKGLNDLNGLTALESIPFSEAGIAQLGDDVSADYWEATEGNAKRALIQLLTLAQLRPDGVWHL